MSLIATAIVLHHTAGWATYAQLQSEQARRNEGYHRIILPDGSVKAPRQIPSLTNGAYGERWAGPFINVALVGPFHLVPVPAAQFEALVQTVAVLIQRYNLSPKIITTHGAVGQRWGYATACPGSYVEKMLPYAFKRWYIYHD